MNLYDQKMAKYNELTKLVDGTCSRPSPKMLALKFSLEIFEQTIVELKEIYNGHNWRLESVLEGFVYSLELNKVPAQKRVIRFLELTGTTSSDTLYRIFNKKTIDVMFAKNLLKEERCSRLREDDREMVYWDMVKLTSKLEKALT